MDVFADLLRTLSELRAALAVRGDDAATTTARQEAEALASTLGHRIEAAREHARSELAVAVARAAHERASTDENVRASAESFLRGERLRAEVAESQRKNLEAQLASLRAASTSRIGALEEEVEALLSPQRADAARHLYEARRTSLTAELASARAQRERLEVLLSPGGAGASEIERARDASLIEGALERETELADRLAETEARLERVRLER